MVFLLIIYQKDTNIATLIPEKTRRKATEDSYSFKKFQRYLNSGGRGFPSTNLPPGTRFENASQQEIYRVKKGNAEALMAYNGETPIIKTRANGTPNMTVDYEFHKLSTGEPFIIKERSLPKYQFYGYTPSIKKRIANAMWERRRHLINAFHKGPTTGGGSAAAATVVPSEVSVSNTTTRRKTLKEILAGKTFQEYKPPGHTGGRRKTKRRARR